MKRSSDSLVRLRKACNLALNEDALRLLRHAITHGALERRNALALIGRSDLTRSSAENLADRLEKVDLLQRQPGRLASFEATDLAAAVVGFVDKHLDEAPAPVARPTTLFLEDDDRRLLEQHGFELYDVLTRAAIDIASLRRS
jgi:hypothetical protein